MDEDEQFNRFFVAIAAGLALVLTIVLWPFLDGLIEVAHAVLALGSAAGG